MADSTSGPEDPDFVTFVVPRVHARSVHEHLRSLALTVGRAPDGVVPMAAHDTHLAVPDRLTVEHLTRIADRFEPDPSTSPFDSTRIVRRTS